MDFHNGFYLAVTYITELNVLNDKYNQDLSTSMQEVIDNEWSYFLKELLTLLDKLYLMSLVEAHGNYRFLFDNLLWEYGVWVGEFWEEESEFREEILNERLAS